MKTYDEIIEHLEHDRAHAHCEFLEELLVCAKLARNLDPAAGPLEGWAA